MLSKRSQKPKQSEDFLNKLTNKVFRHASMEKEIRLSSNEFRALASETRASIIKLLQQRNHTLTELSKKLRLAAPTVKQHLGVLTGAELIQEMDEGRKWKYYSLTRKGKNIFSPETSVNVLIVLGISIFALVGMIYSFVSVLGSQASFAESEARGQAFIGALDKAAVPSAGEAATKVAEWGVEPAAEAIANGAAVPQATAGLPFEVQMLFLLFGIAAIAVIAGFFIARTKRL